jgi:catalase
VRYQNPGDPVYAPNSFGGPAAAPELFGTDPSWHVTGEILRSAYTLHKEDDDFGQANAMVNKAMDEEARKRLVSNIVGHAGQAVTGPVLSRVVAYWRNVDKAVGDQVAAGLGV